MNGSQRKHLSKLLDRVGFEFAYQMKNGLITMEVWIRKDVDHPHELHILTSATGLFRIMLCTEISATDDGSNPNLDDVFTQLERLALP
jgi:hypothetical protein